MRHKKLLYIAAFCSALIFMADTASVSAQSRTPKGQKTRKTTTRKSSLTPGQYPETSERMLTEQDVEHVTPWGMKVMQNEIYARHGFQFRDPALRKHFRKEKWYKGTERNMKKIKLTDTEVQNIAFLKQHQPRAKQ